MKLESSPMDRPMLCAIMRRVSESSCPLADVESRIEEARREEARRQVAKASPAAADRELKRIRDAVRVFQENSGVDIESHWHAERIGRVVKFIVANDLMDVPDVGKRLRDEVERARNRAASVMDKLDSTLEALAESEQEATSE
jgi:hypothetical protein